jgi:hypothetical protein
MRVLLLTGSVRGSIPDEYRFLLSLFESRYQRMRRNQNKKYLCAIGRLTAGSQVNNCPSARTV